MSFTLLIGITNINYNLIITSKIIITITKINNCMKSL